MRLVDHPGRVRYVAAVVIIAAAWALRFALDPLLRHHLPFEFFYGAVALVVWLAGYGPGVLAALLGILAASYFFIAPRYELAFDDLPTLIPYAVVCAIIIALGEVAHRRRERATRYADALEAQAERLRTEAEERRTAELATEAAHARTTSILESISDAFFVLDRQWRITHMNSHAERYFRRPRTELLGRVFWDLFPELRGTESEANHTRAMRERVPVRFEFFSPFSGRWLEINDYPSEEGVSVFFRDVTERKHAEEALRESEARLRFVLEHSPDHIFLQDAELRYVWAIGAPRQRDGRQFVGLTDQDICVVPEEGAALTAAKRRVLAENRGLRIELALTRTGGERRFYDTVIEPWRDASERAIGILGYARDITERRRTEEALRSSERFSTAVLNSLPAEIAVLDRAGRILAVNEPWLRFAEANAPGAVQHLGVGADYAAVCRAAAARGDALAREALVGLTAVLAGRSGEFQLEYPCHAPGRQRWFRMQVARGATALGGAVVAHTDISERKRLEGELRESVAKLAAADRKKDEFLATLAHELRNPLAPIRNAVHFLRTAGPPDEELQRARSIIERQARHLARLVDDLLDVSRINRGRIELKRERVDLNVAVANALEASRTLIDSAHHQLSVELPREPVYVEGDAVRLSQIFANLLNNAAKYTPSGGHVALRLWAQAGTAVVRITDSGVGIPREMLGRIFDMFAQVEPSLERAQGGLGIGLALAQQLARLHGGRIEAESAGRGCGSTFTVHLPLAGHEVEAPAAPPEPDVRTTRPLRVLVADDNEDAAESLSMLLQSAGHVVRVTYDGLEALEAMQDFHPDVVLLDIGMPRLNGYEAARRMRALPGGHELTMIALTGWGKEEDKQRAREAGFDHHLTKPVDPAVIERLLAERAREPLSG